MRMNKSVVQAALFLIIVAGGCSRLPGRRGNDVMILAKTAVGSPAGANSIKNIGPDGGTISSSDGRITLNIPPNAVTNATEFSIQPITNMADGGIGNAFRLGPNGQKFAIPVEVTFRSDESQLADNETNKLVVAYQDGNGAWQTLDTRYVDDAGKTITVSTTHFTDLSWIRTPAEIFKNHHEGVQTRRRPDTYPVLRQNFRVTPEKATIHPGEKVTINFLGCEHTLLYRLAGLSGTCEYDDGHGFLHNGFRVEGSGYVSPNYNTEQTVYVAPSVKPNPNVVKVIAYGRFFPDYEGWEEISPGHWEHYGDEFYYDLAVTEITIVDRGYKVSGQDGPVAYSGVVCDLERPFAVTGTHPLFEMTYNFVPSGPTAGSASYAVKWGPMNAAQSGPYSVEGAGTDKLRIVWHVQGTARIPQISTSGGGDAHIVLTPLAANEGFCN